MRELLDLVLEQAHEEMERARAETELLAVVAHIPLQAMTAVKKTEFDFQCFRQYDLALIFQAFEIAYKRERRPIDRLDVAVIARDLLRDAGYWRDDELRSFVSGSSWGPGPLSALMHAISSSKDFDPQLLDNLLKKLG